MGAAAARPFHRDVKTINWACEDMAVQLTGKSPIHPAPKCSSEKETTIDTFRPLTMHFKMYKKNTVFTIYSPGQSLCIAVVAMFI